MHTTRLTTYNNRHFIHFTTLYWSNGICHYFVSFSNLRRKSDTGQEKGTPSLIYRKTNYAASGEDAVQDPWPQVRRACWRNQTCVRTFKTFKPLQHNKVRPMLFDIRRSTYLFKMFPVSPPCPYPNCSMNNHYVALAKWWRGETKVPRESVPLPFCSPHISHWLTRDQHRLSAATDRPSHATALLNTKFIWTPLGQRVRTSQ